MRHFCVLLWLAGCAAQKSMPDEDFSSLGELDQKSDAFSSKLRILGPLGEGQSRDVYYTSSPRFRGYTLDGSGPVDLWVRSKSGDALAWLLDSRFHVVRKNDDADSSTYDAHISAEIPADATFPYYLVMRDYDEHRGWFTVERKQGASLACSGTGLIATIPDQCMDDGGANGVGDSLQIYCFNEVARFCLSGETCPWRGRSPRSDDGTTCSRAGLGSDTPESEENGPDFMAHATCHQWRSHEWYDCSPDGQIAFR